MIGWIIGLLFAIIFVVIMALLSSIEPKYHYIRFNINEDKDKYLEDPIINPSEIPDCFTYGNGSVINTSGLLRFYGRLNEKEERPRRTYNTWDWVLCDPRIKISELKPGNHYVVKLNKKYYLCEFTESEGGTEDIQYYYVGKVVFMHK